MMIMQKLGQLFTQTLIAFAVVAEYDRTLEQNLLKLLRQLAP